MAERAIITGYRQGKMIPATDHRLPTMFIHSVYFWLKPDLTDAERDRFWAGVRSLTTIESVRHGFAGVPAATDRPIIDRSYSCALIVMFDDDAGHEAYQVHPIHDRFREECAPFWTKVLIYDAVN
jgi:hypothetical protein